MKSQYMGFEGTHLGGFRPVVQRSLIVPVVSTCLHEKKKVTCWDGRWLVRCLSLHSAYKGPLVEVSSWQMKPPYWCRIVLRFTIFIFKHREINYCWQMDGSKGEGGGFWQTMPFLTVLPARGHYLWPWDARHVGHPTSFQHHLPGFLL